MYDDATTIETRRMGRPKKSVTTESVRLRSDMLVHARKVASLRQVDLSDYLSDILMPVVVRDLKAEKRKIVKEDLGE